MFAASMAANPVEARQAEHAAARPLSSGTEPPTRPVLPPCGERWRCRARRTGEPPAPLRRWSRGGRRPAPGRASACASRPPRRRGRRRRRLAAPTTPRRRSSKSLMSPRPRRWRKRARTCTAQATKISVASSTSRPASQAPMPRSLARPDRAFGDVEPDQQAHPAVGVEAHPGQTGQGQEQGQGLDREGAAAGRREPELPREAQQQQGDGGRERERACPGDRRVRCGTVGHRPYDASNDLRRRAVTAPTTVVARPARSVCTPGRGTAPR